MDSDHHPRGGEGGREGKARVWTLWRSFAVVLRIKMSRQGKQGVRVRKTDVRSLFYRLAVKEDEKWW